MCAGEGEREGGRVAVGRAGAKGRGFGSAVYAAVVRLFWYLEEDETAAIYACTDILHIYIYIYISMFDKLDSKKGWSGCAG